MTTPIEALNNAITRLEYVAQKAPEARRKAIVDLAKHWQRYVWARDRRTVAPSTLAPLLERYVAWYVRAYALLTPELRALAVEPRDIDVTFAALADAEVRRLAEGLQAANKVGDAAVQAVVRVSADAARGTAELADSLFRRGLFAVVVIGAMLALVLWQAKGVRNGGR